MKKTIYFLLFIFTSFLYAQELYKIDYKFTDNTGGIINSTLLTDNNEATFKVYDERDRGIVDHSNGDVSFVENDSLSKFFYSNKEKSYYRFPLRFEEIIYSDELKDKLKWKINPDSKKKIGKYNCTEAKLFLNGRYYTAWFTFDVPIKFGPLKLHGLPGLVVEASDEKGIFKVQLVTISKQKNRKEFNKYKNYFLKKKDIMNYSDFEKKIVEIEVNNKIRWIAEFKKMDLEDKAKGYDIDHSVNEDMSDQEIIDNLIEYPSNLKIELKKYRY
ncbi:GLPGLI family protein [Flavobacterium croceum]|uniref:GLPGLI family protein n=1 Tax=Flavobacterium croceum TaxID=370975 RepID=UPI0024A964A3|nr:GLPGLI family protein [Flavobacterium croceum]